MKTALSRGGFGLGFSQLHLATQTTRGTRRPSDTDVTAEQQHGPLATHPPAEYNAGSHPSGAVAQLGEHHVRNVGVEGSNPFCSTKFFPRHLPRGFLPWLSAQNQCSRGCSARPARMRPALVRDERRQVGQFATEAPTFRYHPDEASASLRATAEAALSSVRQAQRSGNREVGRKTGLCNLSPIGSGSYRGASARSTVEVIWSHR
jgi:hypothetical protein